jgi:hypothetical protein
MPQHSRILDVAAVFDIFATKADAIAVAPVDDLHLPLHSPVAYVGALQARLVSERSRKRCACGGVGTPRCTWA